MFKLIKTLNEKSSIFKIKMPEFKALFIVYHVRTTVDNNALNDTPTWHKELVDTGYASYSEESAIKWINEKGETSSTYTILKIYKTKYK